MMNSKLGPLLANLAQARSQTQASPSLAGFGKYALGGPIMDSQSDEAQAWLKNVQQYDPSARFEGSGNEGSTDAIFKQDRADLMPPNAVGGRGFMGMLDLNPGIYNGGNYRGDIINKQAVGNKGPYGQVTSNMNEKNKGTWLDIVGPLIVGGAIGAGGAGLLGGMGTQANPWAKLFMNSLQTMGKNGGKFPFLGGN